MPSALATPSLRICLLTVTLASALPLVAGCDPAPAEPDASAPPDAWRPDGAPRPDGAMDCTTDEDCEDAIPCTRTSCDPVGGFCRVVTDHAPCDDGIFCNGTELCDPRRGCMPSTGRETCNDDQVCTIDRCDEATRSCEHFPRDLDDDGDADFFCDGGDCDDRDPTRSSARSEVCADDLDNDCDGTVDEAGCGRPAYDTCDDALDISAGGIFTLTTEGATPDYTLNCLGSPRGDLVATFTLTEARDVRIEADGDLFTTAIALRPMDMCEVPSAEIECRTGFPSRIRRRSLAPGTYALLVSGFGTGEVALDVRFTDPTEPPANEDCSAPIDVSAGGTFTASMVDVRDDLTTSCGFSGSPDLVYVLTTTAEQDVQINATSLSGESMAWDLRPTCAATTGSVRCAYGGPASGTVHQLPAGTYYLVVEGPSFAEVDISLDVRILPPTPPPVGDLCSTAIPLALGVPTTGSLAPMQDDLEVSCGFRYRDVVYAVTLPETSDLEIEVDGGSFMNASFRRDCTDGGTQIRCTSGSPVRQRIRGLAAGTYYVIVEASRAASFTITATAVTPPSVPMPVSGNDTCATATVVPATGGLYAGTTVGRLDDYQTALCGAGAQSPDAAFLLTLTETRRVRVSTDGSSFNTVLHMHRTTCALRAEVACDDNGGDGVTSVIERTLDPATYLFIVDGWGMGTTGSYEIEFVTYDP